MHGHFVVVLVGEALNWLPDIKELAVKLKVNADSEPDTDVGPYGKQVVQFYTQTKTVTSRWFVDKIVNDGVNTTINLKKTSTARSVRR